MSKDMDIEQAAQATMTTTSIEVKAEPVTVAEPTATITVVAAAAAAATNGDSSGKAAEEQKQQAATATTITTITEQVQPTVAAAVESTASKGNNKSNMDPTLINFKVLYVLTQLCGLTMIVLVGTWIGQHFGGLGGTDNPKQEFNWHPLFMTIGFIYLYGNSILVYRGFRTTRKKTLKLTHAGIHMAAFVLTVIALKTVFDSHNLVDPPIPNMYSLHSWLGLSAVIIFCLQYVAGFMAFLVPGMRENYKIALMPLHIYFGLFGFVLAIASAVMGLTEKAIFAIPNYSKLPSAGVLANIIGVLYVVFGGLVVYLATEPSYKRKPIPEDTALLTANGNE
ncbi:plasma membrane ascorbate-dependent reductase CYBRD1 isoform X1 [Drosophila mojavensis]|uniref:plasma membrane ascorbate-dependent reductase CYBRD1 isoform X1 n=1 Tax=Drosophila mojavensis TaxID=7230 RepID=UPI001CD0A698|nr:plasma membrane ascorbate-dependent reductase CYBRD1 isoform X1 [Drosophila mojavensis]